MDTEQSYAEITDDMNGYIMGVLIGAFLVTIAFLVAVIFILLLCGHSIRRRMTRLSASDETSSIIYRPSQRRLIRVASVVKSELGYTEIVVMAAHDHQDLSKLRSQISRTV
uniref:4.1m domain-containing protein n=1 Tax=Steinernema glaseri TaxID=37863 RepID=A0A1I7XWX8_9BILA